MTGTILIADGVPTNRIVLRVKLRAAYYDVLQAATGAEALLEVRRNKPDLVIASADLPDMAGRDFCLRLRALPQALDTPVILVHSEPDYAQRIRALAAGADDVISRPVDELVLLARLRSLLRARHAEDELRLRDDTRRALGLAEPPASFLAPARVALLPMHPDIDTEGAANRLRARLSDRIETMSPDRALRAGDNAPEVFVILDTGPFGPSDTPCTADRGGEGLALLTQLRASPALRQSAIVYVTDADRRRDAANALDLGANDLVARGLDTDELIIRLPKQISRKRTADRLRANMRHGLRAAVTDPLTGLYNRRYAMPHIERMSERAVQQNRTYAVLLADLDHFKRINDQWGHGAGDQVLIELSRRLMSNLRAADLVARIGGEEFMIAMPDADRDAALRTANRLCQVMANRPVILPNGAETVVTLSIGVAMRDSQAVETSEALLHRADRALYCAKNAGRNRVALAATEVAGPPAAAIANRTG